jgi:hypothetical protein
MKPRSAASRRHLSASPFKVQPVVPLADQFAVRDRVSHDTHGLGRIVAIVGETVVVADFAGEHVRMSAPFNKLVRL